MAIRRRGSRNGYEDNVALTGEVRAVDLDGLNFNLRLDDGETIPGKFNKHQEGVITEALQQHATRRVSIRGRGEFTQRKGRVKRIVSVEEFSVHKAGSLPYDPTAPPVWEVIDDIMKDVPEEVLRKLPLDGAENHDHYIYGTPKKKS